MDPERKYGMAKSHNLSTILYNCLSMYYEYISVPSLLNIHWTVWPHVYMSTGNMCAEFDQNTLNISMAYSLSHSQCYLHTVLVLVYCAAQLK